MSRLWVLTDSAALRERMPAALVDALEARGTAPRLVVADRAPASWRGLARGDLVVARTHQPGGLALLQAAELHGARSFDSHAAVRCVRNKAQATLALARAGVAVPDTVVAYDAEHAARVGFPLVVKPVFGDGERGVGETLASGTGATGAAVAHVLRGGDSPVTVELDGGELVVDVGEDLHVDLTGWAVPVCRGELSAELEAELRSL